MSDGTPITNRIRKAWITHRIRKSFRTAPEASQEFDRWLAEHDRQTAEKAWDEGQCTQLAAQAIELPRGVTIPVAWNPYREASE